MTVNTDLDINEFDATEPAGTRAAVEMCNDRRAAPPVRVPFVVWEPGEFAVAINHERVRRRGKQLPFRRPAASPALVVMPTCVCCC
jgi:hypothetical protein